MIAEVQLNPQSAAVSPDGRRIAYWQVLRGGGQARVLWLLDGAALTQPRVILTLADSETAAVSTGGGVVWSSDGGSLLIGINSIAYESAGAVDAGRYTYAALREVEISSGSVREITRIERALPLRPVALDRGRHLAAAVEIGGGGYIASYVVAREGGAVTRTALGINIAPALGTSDASRVLALRFLPSGIYVWSLVQPEGRTMLEAAPDERVETALWRNSREIVVLIGGDSPSAHRLEVWNVEGGRRVVLAGAQDLAGVRPDGTAAILDGQVVDLDTGAVSAIPGSLGSHGVVFARVVSVLLH